MTERVQHRVTVNRTEGFKFDVSFEAAPTAPSLSMDEPPPLGAAAGPNAADLVCAAVANCLAASLVMCLQKSRATIGRLSATATARIERSDKGRLRIVGIDVHIEPGTALEDASKLERCLGLYEDFCIVTASLRQGIPVNVRVGSSG